ncbi:acyl-CoA dehydrogenase [Jatrophihabitans sp.]|uniref:acyl-CoA dehydrogenase n=1 Tax=Jatrophihabitans sp. TaxID=1932789 RepID=UPI0030C68A1D|nr:hypothetical protein [Jatrophihabitans sp.]
MTVDAQVSQEDVASIVAQFAQILAERRAADASWADEAIHGLWRDLIELGAQDLLTGAAEDGLALPPAGRLALAREAGRVLLADELLVNLFLLPGLIRSIADPATRSEYARRHSLVPGFILADIRQGLSRPDQPGGSTPFVAGVRAGCDAYALVARGDAFQLQRLAPSDYRVQRSPALELPHATITVPTSEPGEGRTSASLELDLRQWQELAADYRVMAAGALCGVADEAIRLAVAHAQVREQFGRQIGSFQAVKHLLAGAKAGNQAAWSLCVGQQAPADSTASANRAWLLGVRAVRESAEVAVQVFGGMGFTWEHPAQRYLKYALTAVAVSGGPESVGADVARAFRVDMSGTGGEVAPILDDHAEERALREQTRAALATLDLGRSGADSFARRRDIDRLLAEHGLLNLTWPAEYGGRGLGPAHQAVLESELAAVGISVAKSPARIGINLLGPSLMAFGTPEQKDRFLGGIASVEQLWCQGFSEPEAGSDLAGIRTRARQEGTDWVLTGSKIWISQAHEADWCFLLARTGPEGERHHNLTMFLLPMTSGGVSVVPIRQATGESEFNEVFLDDVRVPSSMVLGPVNAGWRVAMTTLTSERSYGQFNRAMVFRGLLDELDQLCIRAYGGRDHSRLARLGGLVARVSAIEALARRSLRNPDEAAELAPVMKLWWSETFQELTALGYETAVTADTDVDVWTTRVLDSRASTIYAGTSQIQKNMIAERFLGLPRG